MSTATIDTASPTGLAGARQRWAGIEIIARLGRAWFRGWVQYVTMFSRADHRAGPLPWK